MSLRALIPLVAVVSCLGQSVSSSTYQMIVTSQYTGYSFTSYHQTIIQNKVSDLGLTPKVTVVCPESVCPSLICSRSFSYFQQNGCSLVSASRRGGEVLQNTGTYVEYVFYDTNPSTATPFATRVSTATARVATVAALGDPTVTYAGVTTPLLGVPIGATPIPFSTTPSPSDDDDISKQWWLWLLIALIVLCCCCIAAYFLCFKKKKKNKDEQMWKEQPHEMGRIFVPGDSVEALYDDKWFGATVTGGNGRDGYTLEWDDGSVSDNVNPSDIRLRRAPPVAEIAPPIAPDAPIGVGHPVVALSGGKYHSGIVRSVRGDSVMVEKANGSLQQFHAGSLQRDLYNEEVISARSGSPPGHTMYRVD